MRNKGIIKIFKFTLSLLILLIILFALGFEIYTCIEANSEGNEPLPANFGNFERVRNLLTDKNPDGDFSFGVVGDISGRGTFEKLCDGLREEPLAFLVILGDAVRTGTHGYHAYLKAELREELSLPFPTFYVVGNHDVDKDDFTLKDFEETYGPTNFYFDYKGCLFIILRIIGKEFSTDESVKFLEDTLIENRGKFRKTFVLMHIPPPISNDFFSKYYDNQYDLIALFDSYKVDYVITGDYHGYARVKVKNTTYLVTGGGGAHLKDVKFGHFHHAIVIKVGKDSISERILASDHIDDIEDGIERYAIAEFYPWLRNHSILAIAINIIFLCFLAIIIWNFTFKKIYK